MLQWCEAASSRYMRTRMGVDVKDHHEQVGTHDALCGGMCVIEPAGALCAAGWPI